MFLPKQRAGRPEFWATWEHTKLSWRDGIWAGPWRGDGAFDWWIIRGRGPPQAQRTLSGGTEKLMCNVWCFLKAKKDFWRGKSTNKALGDDLGAQAGKRGEREDRGGQVSSYMTAYPLARISSHVADNLASGLRKWKWWSHEEKNCEDRPKFVKREHSERTRQQNDW